jgi:uncharacterized membrane protein YgcG
MASIEEVSHRCSTPDCVSGVTNAIRAKDGRLVGEHCRRHVHTALKVENEKERNEKERNEKGRNLDSGGGGGGTGASAPSKVAAL